MREPCDAAWLAAYALGLATAGRSDGEAVRDLARDAQDADTCCEAIDRLADSTLGGTQERQRAIDLLARAAALASARGGPVADEHRARILEIPEITEARGDG